MCEEVENLNRLMRKEIESILKIFLPKKIPVTDNFTAEINQTFTELMPFFKNSSEKSEGIL
jgi:hypothetical protein